MGVCFPRPNNNEGDAQFLKPYTRTRCAVMRVRFRIRARAKYTYTAEWPRSVRVLQILASKEHLTLFFYPSSSLFSQRRPFTFRPPHSLSSSALPSSLIKPWRLSAKRTSSGTPAVAEHYEWDEGQGRYRGEDDHWWKDRLLDTV